jgi:hypothetical protein
MRSCCLCVTGSVERVFAGHIYGILDKPGRYALLTKRAGSHARSSWSILDDLPVCPQSNGSNALFGQDGEVFSVFRRHFEAQELADEIGGRVLFAGRFYVAVVAVNKSRVR